MLSGLRRGCDYLPLSITETEGSQCECSVCSCQAPGSSPGRCSAMITSRLTPSSGSFAYLASIERSPNTVKAYAHDLKDWFTFLAGRDLDWREVTLEDVAGYVAWLRLPPEVETAGCRCCRRWRITARPRA